MTPGYGLGFRSLDAEVETSLPVEGSLPAWLSGSLVRNGPALFEVGGRPVAHWFDGLAMLRRFAFDGGRVDYRNRFLRSGAYRTARDGHLVPGFADVGSGDSALARFATLLVTAVTDSVDVPLPRVSRCPARRPADNANVIVERIGGEYVALTEAPYRVAVDPETLATLGTVRPNLPRGHLTCAHLHHDRETGEVVGYDTRFGHPSRYLVHATAASGERRLLASLAVRDPSYMHSFALTPNYVVLTEFPLVVDPLDLLRPDRRDAFIDAYRWEPERGTRVTVLDRRTGGVVARPVADPLFGFHHVNAFERGDELVCDLVTFPDPSPVEGMYLDVLRGEAYEAPGGALTRLRIELRARGTPPISMETRYDGGITLPRLSPRVRGREHRYVYGQGTHERVTDFAHEVVKVDATTGETRRFSRDGWYFGEPVFVPAPRPAAEDEGVALTVALDVDAGHSWLVVLDGEAFEERARAALPHAVPFDFHGQFFPELGSGR
ncbi:carotenoid oxygenase family protein [Halomarina halobia]|uniref:Carotenoid oxygenase family protein n=1 Tax=Halomarina halobia TaxID=3033386 RepID=A0ABD6A7F7_9EURY|nr:carotenoid oxygenase family protein [Halomarina sp. PSR21]